MLSDFGGEVGNVKEGVLDLLLEGSEKLTKLIVNHMKNASEQNLDSLVYMIDKVLKLPDLPLNHLDLYKFSRNPQHGHKLLQCPNLLTQPMMSLSLNLGCN